MDLITLTTDFGSIDPYVASMKGVIYGMAPNCHVIDVCHDVPRHDILSGAYILYSIWPYYPEGTLHVAVVDPGVGSDRRIVLSCFDGQYVLAPDNGLVSMVHHHFKLESAYVVENQALFLSDVSATFHGRDIMASVAGHLACGLSPSQVGRVCHQLKLLPVDFHGARRDDGVCGQVIHVDRYGNLVTNIHRDDLRELLQRADALHVFVGADDVGPVRGSYVDGAVGFALATIGSMGYVEISVNQGDAAERFGRSVLVRVMNHR